MKKNLKKSWYSIIIVLMITGFLLVLTSWVLNLVLRELNDNKWAWNYLKAFAWAEAAQELALLQIKKHSYWVYDKINLSETDNRAKILRNQKNDKKEILIAYDLNSKTKVYSWTLEPFKQAVIPLFYIKTDDSIEKIDNLKLKILNNDYTDKTKMAWNIISKNWDWIWWNNEIDTSTKGKWRKADWHFLAEIKISWNNWFLKKYDNNYLIIINLDPNKNLTYQITSNKYFTKPISNIISQAKIWNYKQNLETTLDNTAFLSILKYSVYSK